MWAASKGEPAQRLNQARGPEKYDFFLGIEQIFQQVCHFGLVPECDRDRKLI
jgi:hypothetical protein